MATPTGPSFADYATRWLATQRHRLRPGSYRIYETYVRLYLEPTLKNTVISAISRGHVLDLLESLVREGLAESTIKGVHSVLHQLLEHAVDRELLPANPAHGVLKRLFTHRSPPPDRTPMTPDQLASFLTGSRHYLGPAWHVLFTVMSKTGLRVGEALGLQWGDCHLDERFVTIKRTWHDNRTGPPKSGQPRDVDLSRETVAILSTRRSEGGGADSTFIFGPVPWHRSTVWRRFQEIVQLADLPGHFTPHSLRHTYASILLAAGVAPQYVRQQLGHASLAMTTSLYGNHFRAPRPDTADILDAPLPRLSPRIATLAPVSAPSRLAKRRLTARS